MRLAGGEPKSEAVATPDISPKVNILEEVRTSVSVEVFCSKAATRTNRKMVYTIEISEYHMLLYV